MSAVETSQFHVADAATLPTQDPIAVPYVATVLAHRLNAANHVIIQLKSFRLQWIRQNIYTERSMAFLILRKFPIQAFR
jgi:hypothetical protein